ncbi:hypothetical protein [Thermocrispum municipale]|uniref:hypothetical protein n=1 Tax=Thermocrispum municipale TaxID=37926 RepID=UPI0003FF6CE9|nr:hypothetical protein [Thermocrispum municipale]
MAGLTGPMLPHWKPLQYDVPAETAWPRWARLLSRALTLTVVIAVGLWLLHYGDIDVDIDQMRRPTRRPAQRRVQRAGRAVER